MYLKEAIIATDLDRNEVNVVYLEWDGFGPTNWMYRFAAIESELRDQEKIVVKSVVEHVQNLVHELEEDYHFVNTTFCDVPPDFLRLQLFQHKDGGLPEADESDIRGCLPMWFRYAIKKAVETHKLEDVDTKVDIRNYSIIEHSLNKLLKQAGLIPKYLDHYGCIDECKHFQNTFVTEPYIDSPNLGRIQVFADLLDVNHVVYKSSTWNPGRCCRIEFYPKYQEEK